MWAGIKGTGISATIQGLIQGKDPRTLPQVNAIDQPDAGTSFGGGDFGGLADTLMAHLDHPYLYGGACGPDGSKPWDCSNAVDWAATKNGLKIPGFGAGKWNMVGHGPSTLIWLAWAPANMKKIPASQAARNDLAIWPTHMGICLNNTDYVSAAGHGVKVGGHTDTVAGPIHGGGPSGELVTFWRYRETPGELGGTTFSGGSGLWTHDGLVKLWGQAGGSAATANNAACHGMQESSGRASVTSSNPDGGTNVGLWQLDTRGVGAGHTVAQLQDPLTNARLTVHATKNGRDWSSWATPGC